MNDGFLDKAWPGILAKHGPAGALGEALTRWSEADAKPLVLLVDEIDALVGDTLLSVLRQLRAGYVRRPAGFPQSVVLCGVRDVRDYRIHSGSEKAVIAGGSAFNVKARSLRLGDFSRGDVTALLAQHTGETGQAFEREALETIWERTRGQPWLVNALADETCFRVESGRDRSRAITADDGRIPDFPVTRSHPPASWPSAANSSICRTYRKTAGEESRRRSPVANRWMRP